jgi:aminomethyltransferase
VIAGADAGRFIDRVITRNASTMSPGQVIYTPWCDEHGRVIDDGTISRLDDKRYRWTAAEPNLRWLTSNAAGLDVEIEDVSEQIAALALQGPTAASVLRAAAEVDVDQLKYFRVARGSVAGVPIQISRTGYTGDLGYELWVDARSGVAVWDALMQAGRAFGLKPAGLLALDAARIEAGLLLIDVDFVGARKAVIAQQAYTPFELGLGRLVDFGKERFIGRHALSTESERNPARRVVGVVLDWMAIEALYAAEGLIPVAGPTASRAAVPVFDRSGQAGRMTSSTWSPILKKMIGLATVDARCTDPGARLEVEYTIEGVRHRVGALVSPTPFFNPARKTQTPPSEI